ncbi:hypothetical protein DMB42_52420, partial [Nonomuraea sp. WAC 01424]
HHVIVQMHIECGQKGVQVSLHTPTMDALRHACSRSPNFTSAISPVEQSRTKKSQVTFLARMSPWLRTLATTVFRLPGHGVSAQRAGSSAVLALRTSMSGLFHSGGPFQVRRPGSGRPSEPYSTRTTAWWAAVETTVTRRFIWVPGSVSSKSADTSRTGPSPSASVCTRRTGGRTTGAAKVSETTSVTSTRRSFGRVSLPSPCWWARYST